MLALATIASALSPLELIGDYTWTSPGRTYFSSASALEPGGVGEKAAAPAAAPAAAKSPAAGTSDERNPLCA